MPNSIQLSKFLLDTLVASFFNLFDPLERMLLLLNLIAADAYFDV
jgi:hypothetical protein